MAARGVARGEPRTCRLPVLHEPQSRSVALVALTPADSDLLQCPHRQFVLDLPDAGLESSQEFDQLAIVFGRHLATEDGRLVLEH